MWLWVLRAAWLSLPLTVGGAVADAVEGLDRPLAIVIGVGCWGVWAALVVATLVPHPIGLTGLRIAAPAVLSTALWTAVVDGVSAISVLAVVSAMVTTSVVFLPVVAQQFVDALSYGDERRLPLRVPGLLWVGPIELAWVTVVAGTAAGPLLLGAEQWIAGAALLVIGLPAALLAARSLHALTRRFLVFVPNGVVLHDHLALSDPFLFGRSHLVSIGPAPRDSDGTDLTRGALGLALELRLDTTVRLPVASGAETVETEATAILVTPSRPAAALREAEKRGLG